MYILCDEKGLVGIFHSVKGVCNKLFATKGFAESVVDRDGAKAIVLSGVKSLSFNKKIECIIDDKSVWLVGRVKEYYPKEVV